MGSAKYGQQIAIHEVTVTRPEHKGSVAVGKIYPRSVSGPITSLRRYMGLISIGLFLLLPWLTYDGHQAILLDFTTQRFHLFGLTLWPQDLTLLTWLFIMAAFALFLVTAVWGRVWCGFMCPQTVFTFLFMWVEEKIEGPRNHRILLDRQSGSRQKVLRKTLKHTIWLLIATFTALTFVGYFTPVNALFNDLISADLSLWPTFYVLLFTACTYANAGWLRETMCTHMCPYSRFQSAMFDNDTITTTYNRARGEGRGPRARKQTSEALRQAGLGDCIDCNLCVQVCPTGIDIRNGLQYECINCGACIDACNGVMSKMGYEKDLIAFTSANRLADKKAPLLRPKIVGYFAVLLVIIGAFALDLASRQPFDVDIIRDRTSLYRENLNGNIENVYTLVLMNKTQSMQQLSIGVSGLTTIALHGADDVVVNGGATGTRAHHHRN